MQALNDSFGACLQCEKEGEEEGIQYTSLGGVSLLFQGPKGVVPPRFLSKTCKNQRVKLAGKTAKMIEKSAKNFC